MELHPICRVDFRNPSWQNFFDYMNCIKEHGDTNKKGSLRPITRHALRNRCKAWYMCSVAWGVDDTWRKYKVKKVPNRTRSIILPSPEQVHEFLTYKYVKDRNLNRYIQYHFFIGFFIGIAAEKEWIILNVEDVIFDKNGNCTITATRPKVNNNTRALRIEKTISTSPVHKSLKNYKYKVRPKFAEKHEKAFLVNPFTHKRWTESDLRRFLTHYGKMVYPTFYPYLMRHWCATARLIEWERIQHKEPLSRVSYWLGHESLDQTREYINIAQLFDDTGSWLSRALKRGSIGGLHGSPDIAQQMAGNGFVEQNFLKRAKRTWRDSNPRSAA
jgi:hypothetical protein